jgi:hypothetical protein
MSMNVAFERYEHGAKYLLDVVSSQKCDLTVVDRQTNVANQRASAYSTILIL